MRVHTVAFVLSLVVSASAFAPTHSGLALRQHAYARRAHAPLARLPDYRPQAKLSPIPKVKPLLVPTLGYAGLAGTAFAASQLAQQFAQVGQSDALVVVGAILAPALLLLGEFVLLGGGERVAKSMGGEPADAALTALCARVAKRAGLPAPAHVYEIPTSELNAFAAGFGSGDATIAVTSGIRRALSKDELEAVIAHEIGHIRHSDMRTNMHAAVAIAGLGGLYEVGRYLLRTSEYNDDAEDEEGDPASAGLMFMAAGVTTRLLAHLLQMSISRDAEYEADRVAAELCGPEPMISALTKIDKRAATAPRDQLAARGGTFAHAYISNSPDLGAANEDTPGWLRDLKETWIRAKRLWSTHPTTDDRIAALRSRKR